MLAAAARAGIERMLVMCLGATGRFHDRPSLDEVNAGNRLTRDFVSRHRGFACGLAYATGEHADKGMDALRRELDAPGMVGIKLWIACRANDPHVFPIVEEAIARRAPILQHAWLKTNGSFRAAESRPEDVADLARRYPQATIMMPHLAGNQVRGLYAVAETPNVILNTSGSDPETGVIEAACRLVGARRIVFGSDGPGRSFASQVAKVTGSRIPERAKRAILWDNLDRITKGRRR